MKTVRVELGARSYDILIAPQLLQKTPEILSAAGIQKRIFVVTNTTVFDLHGRELVRNLESHGFQPKEILIPDGEKHKTLRTVENIYTYLIAQRADRNSIIAALGGGVTGDVAGFVAATFLRGLAFVQIPTTLLAQVDSSVGGKTGFNYPHGKNMIGAFHQPHAVIIDTETLRTLPDREYWSGLYEVLKYGLIYDSSFFEDFERQLEAIRHRKTEVLEAVISRCCEIKAEITSLDERETGLRRILNFGHTFGHALEVVAEYQGLLHGEAVGYGMMAATWLSHRLGLIDKPNHDRILQVIFAIEDLPPLPKFQPERIIEAMEIDKKRQNELTFFILLKGIGETEIRNDVPERLVKEACDQMLVASRQC